MDRIPLPEAVLPVLPGLVKGKKYMEKSFDRIKIATSLNSSIENKNKSLSIVLPLPPTDLSVHSPYPSLNETHQIVAQFCHVTQKNEHSNGHFVHLFLHYLYDITNLQLNSSSDNTSLEGKEVSCKTLLGLTQKVGHSLDKQERHYEKNCTLAKVKGQGTLLV